MRRHGAEFLWELLSKCVASRSEVRRQRNALMLIRYIDSGLSIEKCAALMAEDNKGLSRSERHGPLGTTVVETMKQQIKREKKRMARDPAYRKFIEAAVAELKEAFDNDGDISN